LILALRPDVIRRLHDLEASEGMPAIDIIHEALGVWSFLTMDERRRMGQVAIAMVVERLRASA
jgi:hypothetical protein